MSDVRLGFVTCVQLGLSCMEALYEVGGFLGIAITLNDDQAAQKSGRVYIDDFCAKNNIPLVKSQNVNDQVVINAIKSADLDWLFIIGWSQIAQSELLSSVKKGVLGAHPTLLPVGRGHAAIPWAILKNLKETGVTLFKLDDGVDTGPIIMQKSIEVKPNTTATDLYIEFNFAHIEIIKEAAPLIMNDGLSLIEQDNSKSTIWPERLPEDGKINLEGSVYKAERLVRAVTRPYPGAFYIDDSGDKVIIWSSSVAEKFPGLEYNFIEFYDGFLVLDEIEKC